MLLRVGQIVKFVGYFDVQRGVLRIFRQGQLVVITAIDLDGILECAALNDLGEPNMAEVDLVFPEEVEAAIDLVDLP